MNESPGSLALLSALASGTWNSRRTGIAPGYAGVPPAATLPVGAFCVV